MASRRYDASLEALDLPVSGDVGLLFGLTSKIHLAKSSLLCLCRGSGGDAGILALKELGVEAMLIYCRNLKHASASWQVNHVSSSEINHKAVEFLARNFDPKQLLL